MTCACCIAGESITQPCVVCREPFVYYYDPENRNIGTTLSTCSATFVTGQCCVSMPTLAFVCSAGLCMRCIRSVLEMKKG